MAVYKATYCQPFLSSVDPTALVPTALAPSPYVPLTCNIDTSNQNVTGYSIQIWDSENNLVFPSASANPAYAISPISELSMTPDYSAGVNGTSLTIPFFQLVKYGTASTSVPPFLHSFNAIYCDATSGTFTDVSGNPIDFSVGGSMYKWAITLYQGVIAANPLTASVTPIGSTISISVLYMSYDSLTENYFDMKLASGTVMGSTNKRVQFGYIKNGKGHIADPSVVLQGRYMQLLNGSAPAADMEGPSWRAYVESYDSTYGHAYPISSWSSKYAQNIVDDANYVSFYKYANDPEYVKASEQVVTATDAALSCLQSGGLPIVGGYQVTNGDWVLVKDQGQSDAYENGIYIAHPLGTAWERVAAYDSWAELLGIVVYVSAGNSAGMNWMSQAQAGGALLTKASNLYKTTVGYVFLGAQTAADVAAVRSVGSVTFKNGDLALLQSGYDNSAKTCLEVKFIVNFDNPDGYWGSNGSVKAMDGADYAAICLTGGEISADRSSIDASLNYQPLKMVQDPGGSTVMALVAYDGAASAYSRLYFQPEEPIVLFPDLVTKTVTYLISSNGVSNGISGVTDFDGYGLSDIRTGQTCIDTKVMKLYTASVAGTAVTWTASADAVDPAGIYYVSAGNYYGGKSWTSLVASGTLATRSFAATMAQVFHNSPTTTFVSPFIGMSKRMRIEFQNGQTVTYVTRPAGSSALTTNYLNIDDIDTTIWRITHKELAGSSCVTSTIGGARGLPSGATTAFPSAPYKYNLLSYFQQSDDNAFYAYKIPTLAITDENAAITITYLYNGVPTASSAIDGIVPANVSAGDTCLDSVNMLIYSASRASDGTLTWASSSETALSRSGSYYVELGTAWGGKLVSSISATAPLAIETQNGDIVAFSTWTVKSRKLSLLGSYSQLQRGAWESFQWDLYKADGTLIQTTGKKYQGTMTAVFYGLASGSSYYVILTVVDSLGNVLTQRQDFQISSTASTVVPIPFTMTPECDAQCVKLDYQDTGLVWPAMVFSSKAYAYTLWNSTYLNQSPYSDYDFSLSYPGYAQTDPTDALTYMAITEYGCGDKNVLGDGVSTSSFGIVPIHVWNYPSVMSGDPDYLSYPIRAGLIYQTYFAPSATSAPIGTGTAVDSSLALWDNPGTDVGHDQISAQTCVEIDSNACGEIFALTMGSLTLSVSLPDELSGSGTAYSLNASRNQIVAKLGSSSASLCAPNSSAAYTWFAESASAADQYYYLQFASSDAKAEHFHWPYIGSSGESFYYDKVYNPTASAATARWSATAPAYPMGNLLFITAAEDIGHSCAYYWPDRGFTANYHLLSDVNAYFGVAPVGGGINLAQKTSDKLFLFGDGTTVDPTAYYLDVYDASAGNYVDSPLYGYARRSDSIVGWSGKKIVFTIRGMGLSALSQASSLSSEPVTDSDQTAGIRFTSGTSYLEVDMAIIN